MAKRMERRSHPAPRAVHRSVSVIRSSVVSLSDALREEISPRQPWTSGVLVFIRRLRQAQSFVSFNSRGWARPLIAMVADDFPTSRQRILTVLPPTLISNSSPF
jgi:hypothetical protein